MSTEENNTEENNTEEKDQKPNDYASILISEHVKITDLETGEEVLNKRES